MDGPSLTPQSPTPEFGAVINLRSDLAVAASRIEAVIAVRIEAKT